MKKDHFFKQWLKIKKIAHLKDHIKPSKEGVLKWIKRLFVAGLIMGGLILLWLFVFIIPSLPDVRSVQNLTAAQSSVILDREGGLLYTIHGDENRESVALSEISQYATEAVLAIEDDQFYEHPGVDIPGIIKAVCAEVGICPARGGSTITQQFIKNAFLSPERTYTRKLKEILLALQLERHFTKDEILEMYLNRIPYGSNIYGIERAANAFFDKSAKDLTLSEAAVLASIPKAPTFYSPYGNNKYPSISISSQEIFDMDIKSEQDLVDIDPNFISKGLIGKTYVFTEGKDEVVDLYQPTEVNESEESVDEIVNDMVEITLEEDQRPIYVKGRVDFVLERMRLLGYIDEVEMDEAAHKAEKITFSEFKEEIRAPHFVMYVRQYLEDKYGKDQVEQGGLRVTTTIDPVLQEAAETAIETYAEQNLERYNASNASLVAAHPENGQILSMVGSVNYWNDEIDGKVNVALRPRLPGSSFKPIVYAAAFLQGYAPSTVLYDVRTKFGAWYEPENYDGQYRGPVTMRSALAHSLNVPAVKAGYLAGIPNVLDLARKMGIQLNQPDDWYGLSLALGAGEARLLDMVQSYSIFANGGYKMDPISILKIEDRNGNILEEYQAPQNKNLILDPQVAYLINTSLSDVEARPEGWWRQQLSIPGQVNAAKTGTSNKKKNDVNYPFDTWTIGYTRQLTAGVWAGNSDGTQLGLKASGLDTAGRIWHDFMVEATKDHPRESFDRPEGIKWVKISEKTGLLPSEFTPEEFIKTEAFASFSVPQEYDQSYKVVEIDKISGKLATEYTPEAAIEEKAFFEHHAILPDNLNWEKAVRQWAEENDQDEKAPTEYDDVHTADNANSKPSIVISSPGNMSVVSPPSLGVWVDIEAKNGVDYVEYYWDGELVETVYQPPYKGVIRVSQRGTKVGSIHEVKAVVYDQLLRSNQSTIEVKIGEDDIPPVVNFVYPVTGASLAPNSTVAVQVDAQDSNGDIRLVEFYLGDEMQYAIKTPPYIWQWKTPEKPGDFTLKAIAYDHAKNESTDTVQVNTQSNLTNNVDSSTIITPKKNASFDEGESIVVKLVLDEEDGQEVQELVLLAIQKGKVPLEVANWKNTNGEVVTNHTFVWDSVPAGTYSLSFKVVSADNQIKFGPRVPIVVR